MQQCKRLLSVVTRRSTAQALVIRLVVEGLIELVSGTAQVTSMPFQSSVLACPTGF